MIVRKKNSIYVFLVFFLMVMVGVGYAYFNTTISINGSTALAKNTWDVHFENLVVTDGSVETTSPVKLDDTATLIDFSAKLELPGDFYEFTVDIVNAGSMDAMISEIKMSGFEGNDDFFDYNIVYKDELLPISENDLFLAGSRNNILVRVEYKEDFSEIEILKSDQTLNLSFSITFIQKSQKNTFYSLLASKAVRDDVASQYVLSPKGVDFSQVSSSSNGRGLYMKSDTADNRNPIYYYRGDVDNNNVHFANKCWKIVRTTETGGVKLIYNGEERYPKLKYEEYINVSNSNILYPFEFDSSTSTWNGDFDFLGGGTINFSVAKEGVYILRYRGIVSLSNMNVYIDDELFISQGFEYNNGYSSVSLDKFLLLGELTPENKITIRMTSSDNSGTLHFSLSRRSDEIVCDKINSGSISIGNSIFNENASYLSSAGYMYSDLYVYNTQSINNLVNVIFGNDVIYENGSYSLIDTYTLNAASWEYYDQIKSKYHYSCFSTSESVCKDVNYVFWASSGSFSFRYITLSDGKKSEDVVNSLFVNTPNKNESSVKRVVDKWYYQNMIPYTGKLEDTAWCNDRSVTSLGGWSNNGNISSSVYFSTRDEVNNVNIPNLECSNLSDRFTVRTKNGNGKLTYPVALLSADEVILAGGGYRNVSDFYLYNNSNNSESNYNFWTISPFDNSSYDGQLNMFVFGNTLNYYNVSSNMNIRPAVSLAPYTEFAGGDGTEDNPYIIK